jgi:hypothetical protein
MIGLTACGGGATEAAPKAKSDADAAKASAQETASAPKAEPAGTQSEDGQTEADTSAEVPEAPEVAIEAIGVAECDQYIEKFSACIESKAPEAEKEQHRSALREQIGAWKQTKAGNAEVAKTALPIGCKTALEGAKVATEPWKCDW